MGLQVEFNSELALRAPEAQTPSEHERIPKELIRSTRHQFVKSGHRVFPLGKSIDLLVTDGTTRSKPIGRVRIVEYSVTSDRTYLSAIGRKSDKVVTRGLYVIEEVYHEARRTL